MTKQSITEHYKNREIAKSLIFFFLSMMTVCSVNQLWYEGGRRHHILQLPHTIHHHHMEEEDMKQKVTSSINKK